MYKDIKGFEGMYQVSENGTIRSLNREIKTRKGTRILKGNTVRQQIGTNGYKIVKLYKNSKQYTFSVHRLVAEHFLEKPSYAECVNHIDGDKTNNVLDNLEWCTYSKNNKEAIRLGLRNKDNLKKQILNEVEKKKIKVVLIKENNIVVRDCSRDMAIFIKQNMKVNSSIETIARTIRQVCKQNEIGFEKIQSQKRRKTAYGCKFMYLKDYS